MNKHWLRCFTPQKAEEVINAKLLNTLLRVSTLASISIQKVDMVNGLPSRRVSVKQPGVSITKS